MRITDFGGFADFLTKNNSPYHKDGIKVALFQANFENLEKYIRSLFASIAYNNFTGVKLYEYEGYYASIFYAYIKALGVELIGEDVTNKGRIDLTIKLPKGIFVIEFKSDGSDALAQIKAMNYYEKYLSDERDIHIVGIEFGIKERNITTIQWEKVK